MVFPCVFLVANLPICYNPAFGKKNKQIFWVKSYFNSLIHYKDMAHVLFSAANFILTLENKYSVVAKDSMCLNKCYQYRIDAVLIRCYILQIAY